MSLWASVLVKEGRTKTKIRQLVVHFVLSVARHLFFFCLPGI